MSAAISLVGIAANFPNPGTFLELDFAQGPAGAGTGPRNALIIGNATASGTATANTQVYGPDTSPAVQTEADVIQYFGTGSQLHRAFLRWTAVNKTTPLYFLVVAPSAGTAATGTLTFTGTSTGVGNCTVFVGDQSVSFAINNGDTPTTQATNCAAAINTQTRWAVTATSSVGVVTVTAKNLGPEGNWIKIGATIYSGTTSITAAVAPTAPTFLTSGATADVNTTALTTILPSKFYYIVSCDSDATNVGRLVAQVNTQALPSTGIRQRVFYGSVDTLANATTSAVAINAPRAELIWSPCVDITPLELAANNAAIYSLLEAQSFPRHNFSLFPTGQTVDQTVWTPIGSRNGPSSAPTVPQITAALNNGITPITLLPNGKTQLVKRVTTRSLNGAVNDYRIRDAHKVTICDFWSDDAVSLTQLQFGGKDLVNDPQQGQPFPQGPVVTPQIWGNALKGLITTYANNSQVQNLAAILAGCIFQRETSPTTRTSALVPLQPVDIADQFNVLCLQTA